MSEYFLGLDSSTQSLTAIIIDLATRKIAYQASLKFDDAAPRHGTRNGVLRDRDPKVVHAPPLMWIETLDALFAKMKQDGAPLGQIKAIAGSGQQHGSVYLNRFAAASLAKLNPKKTLHDNLNHALSRPTSPIWMDSSTNLECDEITKAVGGRAALIETTGSAAFERFTGPQIRKFAEHDPQNYADTAHIALVSSFMASVLSGKIAPIDPGDGAGMNLMDIHTRTWSAKALDATAPGLEKRLPPLAPSWHIIGPVQNYFVARYGIAPDAQCVVWSGDNPCSVIGLGLIEPGQVAISLGTSDTYFGTMKECRTDPDGGGHVFGSPTGDYMSLICFKNGSLAREKVKDQYRLNWDQFAAAIQSTPPGNNGAIMIPWFDPEITPRVLTPGVHRFNLREDDAPANCRAVMEGQMLSMRLHSSWMGIRPTKIFATGGASVDPVRMQILADVHACPVYRLETTASAALGAALRAAHAWHKTKTEIPWSEIVSGFTEPVPGSLIAPRPDATAIYDKMLKTYANCERDALHP